MVERLLRIVEFPFRHRQEAAQKERRNVTKSDFVAQLAEGPLEAEAASLLWDLLTRSAVVADFKPLPDDDFLKLYGLAEEDLDEDIILAILDRLAIRSSQEEIEQAGQINTPRDLIRLIRLVQAKPRNN